MVGSREQDSPRALDRQEKFKSNEHDGRGMYLSILGSQRNSGLYYRRFIISHIGQHTLNETKRNSSTRTIQSRNTWYIQTVEMLTARYNISEQVSRCESSGNSDR